MGRTPKQNLAPDFSDLLRMIGHNIMTFREEKGLSQAELARRSKISATTLNEIETRQFRDVRLSTLSALATTLEQPVARLLEKSELELNKKEHLQLLKASETILKITRKMRP